MKNFCAILILLLLCTSCTQEVSIEREIVPFRITWKAYSGRGEAVQKLVNLFNEEEQKYQIELVSGDENLEEIRNQLDTEKTDFFVLPYRYVQLLGDEGQLDEIPLDLSEKHISESLSALGQVHEKTYGVPWVSHSMALLYNQDLLDRAGVDPESIVNQSSFLTALETIESKTGKDGIGLVGAEHNDLSWMINQFIYGSGSHLMENGAIVINNEKTEEAIQFYLEDLSMYAQDNWQNETGIEVMDHFREGKIAFEIQGLWGITDIWKNGSPFEVGILPLSRISAHSEVGPMMLACRSDLDESKSKLAMRFFDFMTSYEAQEMILQGEYSPEHDQYYPFRLPVREDIIQSDSFNDYAVFKPFIEAYRYPSIDVPDPKWQQVKDQIYTPNLHKLALDEITIQTFLDTVEIQGNTIIGGKNAQ